MTSKTATLARAVGRVRLLILRPSPPPFAVEPTLWLETADLLDELDEDESKHDPAQTP